MRRSRAGGLIVIDDYENRPSFGPVSVESPDGGTKSLLTFKLLTQLMKWRLVARTRVMGNTFFGRKPERADFSRFDAEVCNGIAADVESERDAYLRLRSARAQTNSRY
jgi:hypothetical protein